MPSASLGIVSATLLAAFIIHVVKFCIASCSCCVICGFVSICDIVGPSVPSCIAVELIEIYRKEF